MITWEKSEIESLSGSLLSVYRPASGKANRNVIRDLVGNITCGNDTVISGVRGSGSLIEQIMKDRRPITFGVPIKHFLEPATELEDPMHYAEIKPETYPAQGIFIYNRAGLEPIGFSGSTPSFPIEWRGLDTGPVNQHLMSVVDLTQY